MIVAESIGFAATHTISTILAGLPGYRVTHGSQNFETGGPIGTGSQSPEDFVASMASAAAGGARPVAVHTVLDPRRLRPACLASGIRYGILVRQPERQIESCYAWALRKVLDGDDQAFLTALKVAVPVMPKLGVRANLPNALYCYAVQHVCNYTLLAVEIGAEVLRMEELLSDEARFRATFDVPAETPIPQFEGEALHLASHRGQEGLDAVAAPDRDAIRARLPVSSGGPAITLAQLAGRLGYTPA